MACEVLVSSAVCLCPSHWNRCQASSEGVLTGGQDPFGNRVPVVVLERSVLRM